MFTLLILVAAVSNTASGSLARLRGVGSGCALTVWKFTLPHETHFRSYLYTGPENLRWGHHKSVSWDDPSMMPLYDAYFQMAHQHRLNFLPLAGNGIDEVLEEAEKMKTAA